MFFATHYCSDLCKSLGLTQFDLAPTELKKLERMASFSKQRRGTQCRGSEEQVIGMNLSNYFRHRIRNRSSASEEDENQEDDSQSDSDDSPPVDRGVLHALHEEDEDEENEDEFDNSVAAQPTEEISRQQSSGSRGSSSGRRRRVRNDSTNDSTFSNDEAESYFKQIETKKMFRPRSSCVFVEKDLMVNKSQSIKRRGGISARGSVGDEQKDGEGFMSEFDPNEESILGRVIFLNNYLEILV